MNSGSFETKIMSSDLLEKFISKFDKISEFLERRRENTKIKSSRRERLGRKYFSSVSDKNSQICEKKNGKRKFPEVFFFFLREAKSFIFTRNRY